MNSLSCLNNTFSHCYCCLVVKFCLALWNPMDCSPPGSSVCGIFLGKNTGVSCHFLFKGIFLIQGSSPRLLHWQADSWPLSHQGSPHSDVHSPNGVKDDMQRPVIPTFSKGFQILEEVLIRLSDYVLNTKHSDTRTTDLIAEKAPSD